MRIIEPSHQFLEDFDGLAMVRNIERMGRICYKSEGGITDTSYQRFIRNLITRGHESVIEHEKISVLVICDRGVSHEIVRHRIASYSQESTRYCNYSQDKFGNELTFIRPCFWTEDSPAYQVWKASMDAVERDYFRLLELGAQPQEARSILPNSLKTELVITMNLREWRHFFRLRTAAAAHPQMRQTASALLRDFKARVPVMFDDIAANEQ